MHAQTDHLVLGLGGELEGVDVEHTRPRPVNRSRQVECCGPIRLRLIHSLSREINGR